MGESTSYESAIGVRSEDERAVLWSGRRRAVWLWERIRAADPDGAWELLWVFFPEAYPRPYPELTLFCMADDPYRQEAPLPPLPPGPAAGSARPTLPHLPLGSDPSSARHPGGPLPFPGSPVHSFEMAHEPTYPPRSGRPYSGSAEDAYGGYAAGISTDDVPLTATAQPPAGGGGAGPNIPYAGSAGQQHGYRY